MRENAIIGFDRKIELPWLDATAARVADGAGDREVRDDLMSLLEARTPARPSIAPVIRSRQEIEGWGAGVLRRLPLI